MVEPTPVAAVSRRTVLARGGAALLVAPAAAWPISAHGDSRIVALAHAFRRVIDDLNDLIGEAEIRHGPCAYEDRPEYRGRYHDLLAQEERSAAALAAARPDGLPGLAAKMRAARYFADPTANCDDRLLIAAMTDLERLAAARG